MKYFLELVLLWSSGAVIAVINAQGCAPDNQCGTGSSYVKHYEELSCVAGKARDENCCSKSYDCSSLSLRPKEQCQYKGVKYPLNAVLPQQPDMPCTSNCVCVMTKNGPGFSCKYQTCPALNLSSSCMPLFAQNQCCSTGKSCSPPTAKEFSCKIEGMVFPEGAWLPTSDPTMKCLCQKGFDGTLKGSWCQKINCGIELTAQNNMLMGCAPVYGYVPATACPYKWQCPTPKDVIVPADKSLATPDPAVSCTFGRLALKDGDHVITYGANETCVYCFCSVGPSLSCTEYGMCSPPVLRMSAVSTPTSTRRTTTTASRIPTTRTSTRQTTATRPTTKPTTRSTIKPAVTVRVG